MKAVGSLLLADDVSCLLSWSLCVCLCRMVIQRCTLRRLWNRRKSQSCYSTPASICPLLIMYAVSTVLHARTHLSILAVNSNNNNNWFSPQQEFPSLKSRWGYSRLAALPRNKSDAVLFLGRAASRYVGTWLSRVHWLSHTLTERLLRQVQQQRWQPLAERRYMSTSVLVTSLSQLQKRPWAF